MRSACTSSRPMGNQAESAACATRRETAYFPLWRDSHQFFQVVAHRVHGKVRARSLIQSADTRRTIRSTGRACRSGHSAPRNRPSAPWLLLLRWGQQMPERGRRRCVPAYARAVGAACWDYSQAIGLSGSGCHGTALGRRRRDFAGPKLTLVFAVLRWAHTGPRVQCPQSKAPSFDLSYIPAMGSLGPIQTHNYKVGAP